MTGTITDKMKLMLAERNLPNVILSTTHLSWINLKSNLSLCSKKTAPDLLGYGIAVSILCNSITVGRRFLHHNNLYT
jgi:hypothetical protein